VPPPEAPSLSSTAGDTAAKKALHPIVPDEQDCGVQELTGIIGVIDSVIDLGPDADVGGRSRLDGHTVHLEIGGRHIQMGLNRTRGRGAAARRQDEEHGEIQQVS
jgi:hypothetical protein